MEAKKIMLVLGLIKWPIVGCVVVSVGRRLETLILNFEQGGTSNFDGKNFKKKKKRKKKAKLCKKNLL